MKALVFYTLHYYNREDTRRFLSTFVNLHAGENDLSTIYNDCMNQLIAAHSDRIITITGITIEPYPPLTTTVY